MDKSRFVIMHNTISLDGSFTGFDVNMSLHYEIAGSYKTEATVIGSDTIVTGIEMYGGVPEEKEQDLVKPSRNRDLPYWIVVDTQGKTKGMLHACRSFEFCRDIIVLISEKTDMDFVRYLEARNYDFLVCGKDHVDFHTAFERLDSNYGLRRFLIDSGPTLNGVLITEGLVDEISLVISPVLVGENSTQRFLNQLNRENHPLPLKLLQCERLKEDLILLKYQVMKPV
ncbi:2,5-diamino-6-(ribosylamino)-4(3H)-pyrimidinone 5'-phosphate reductase [Dehalogenimonas formicexedens]|uniref:2,5-diamino-6-(Ribosylamino)-4(3H)-pyrimidinone 5'-phosphate reductase n=1 Tax=Dehalogenimonas formicexedens TaxID=1839801 RepID=A0A1P8F8N9_9CHLR|nr:RibD family protein [Dehalogenimonas formicexedens]APV44839.1 2,5-diamino-6-(ribosylamino)-4(3H)-pyrimidinone 5'-phosphate reductase [Dehalogenimonas formicexedens]